MNTNDKKEKLKNLGNISVVCIIMFIFIVGFIRTVFFPKDINYYENRYSNKIIAPTISNILDNTFQSSIEGALSDQIPLAQQLKKFYNESTTLLSDCFITPILESNSTTYINYKNGSKIFGGYYVFSGYDFEYVKSQFQVKANNYNQLFEKNPDIEFYAYYIEKDTDMNFESGEKIHADDYLFSLLNLDDSKKRSFEIENFEDFSKYFYKTDHHWKHTGSYTAYKEIVDFLACEDEPIKAGKEVLISKEFMGSHSAKAGSKIISEPFYAYEIDFPLFKKITSSQQDGNYGLQEKLIASSPVDSISYGQFYGADDGELIFDTGKTNLDNILVIGNSYDNAILKLLATHFNRTHSIDLRNYEHFNGSKFDFQQYVEENGIDKVLFIGNIDFYASKNFELGND